MLYIIDRLSSWNVKYMSLLCERGLVADNQSLEECIAQYHDGGPETRADARLLECEVYNPHTGEPLDFYNAKLISIINPETGQAEDRLLGRAERRESEDSTSIFLKKELVSDENGTREVWRRDEALPQFENLQDPSIDYVHGKVVLHGTRILKDDTDKITGWQHVFFAGDTIGSLDPENPTAYGPVGMKDIELVELPYEIGGKKVLGVATRPQAQKGEAYILPGRFGIELELPPEKGGKGKFGFTVMTMDVFDPPPQQGDSYIADALQSAPIVEELFVDGVEWGGANELFPLEPAPNGDFLIGVLGHGARWIDGLRQYVGMTWVYNLTTHTIEDVQVILTSDDLESFEAKMSDLTECIFSKSMRPDGNGRLEVCGGAGDTSVFRATIGQPFGQHQLLHKETHKPIPVSPVL